MYEDDRSAIKIEGLLSDSFPCHKGVKQGCMLSPTLFNLFLSDLPLFSFFNQANISEAIKLNNVRLNALIYSDDLVLFGKNASDLRNLFDRLKNSITISSISSILGMARSVGVSFIRFLFKTGNQKLQSKSILTFGFGQKFILNSANRIPNE